MDEVLTSSLRNAESKATIIPQLQNLNYGWIGSFLNWKILVLYNAK